ncbi:MAG: TRAP transporter small permease [Gemmatimonadota bacterium]
MFRILDRILDSVLLAVLGLMAAIVAANVFCRFVLQFSIYWGDEAAQALLVWLTFLGAAVAVRDRAHYAFDYLGQYSRGNLQFAAAIVSRMITLIALIGLFYWGLRVTLGIRPWIMPAMEISRAWVYAAGPIGCGLMIIYIIRDLGLLVHERRVAAKTVVAAT